MSHRSLKETICLRHSEFSTVQPIDDDVRTDSQPRD